MTPSDLRAMATTGVSAPSGRSRCGTFASAILISFLVATLVHAQDAAAPVPDPNLMASHAVRVIAPSARCIAVNESLKLLVAGCKPTPESVRWGLVTYALDDAGNLKPGDPAHLELPLPEPLKAFVVYPLALAFHPKLPLLYVWQDISGPKRSTPEEESVSAHFDHLIIYAIKDGMLVPAPVGAYVRGEKWAYDMNYGSLTFSPSSDRLFFSNYRDGVRSAHGIAFYDLDEKGMPKPTPVPIKGSLDGQGLEKFDLELRETIIDTTPHLRHVPTGMGFYAPLDNFLFTTSNQGVAMWDINNRRAPWGSIHVFYTPGDIFIGGHRKFSAVYGAGANHQLLFRVIHVDGYLTGMPTNFLLHGALIQSSPLLVTDMTGTPNRVVVGGANFVHVVALDDKGEFVSPQAPGAREDIPVISPTVRGIAYLEKLRKLYVPVDKLP